MTAAEHRSVLQKGVPHVDATLSARDALRDMGSHANPDSE
jgi:hypothetical protein